MKSLLFLALLGCSRDIDVGPINELLPEARRSALHFVSREVESGVPRRVRYRVAAPERWKKDHSGMFEWGSGLRSPHFWVYSSCDKEPCKPRDWNAWVDRMMKEERYQSPQRDERLAHRRILSAKNREEDWAYLLIASWRDGDDEADICSVNVSYEYADVLPAFEKACASAVRLGEVKDED